MNQNINLAEIERKAWTTYSQDGLLEIAIGVMMLMAVLSSELAAMGLSDEVRILIYFPLMLCLPVAIMVLGRRYITTPRLGFARFGRQRRRRAAILKVGLVSTQIVLLAILLANWAYGGLSGWTGSIIVTLNIFVAFCLIAYFLDYKRMYIVGALIAASEPVMFYLKGQSNAIYNGLISYGIPAIIIISIGVIALKRYTQEYQLPPKEALDAR